ncbi:adenosylcobinamide-phosphate synthase CbiB [Uliginosibacterium flavum]|uniref:Cobalamin biosynthesis protein CobD n=1 Tax=Uliginosibacterium flavum TaxID=1396831 RepID=A0ABV2TPQ7_9RHOO
MNITLALLLGVLLDRLFGEVPRWHPLVGFGRYAAWLEKRMNKGSSRILRGALSWTALVAPPALGFMLLAGLEHAWIVNGIALYFALGARALREHGTDVARALQHGDLDEARRRVGFLVSRETADMNEEQIARASTESLLENGNDAIFAAIFWCAIGGAPAVILYRLANTLDAMWGYRNARFNEFGRIAARVDDVLNFIPARLTALTYALLGQTRCALRSWRAQASSWSSPNAGPVMAAGAGSLGLQLGGSAIYEGVVEERTALGEGRSAQGADIPRASRLISRGLFLWITVIGLGEALVYFL